MSDEEVVTTSPLQLPADEYKTRQSDHPTEEKAPQHHPTHGPRYDRGARCFKAVKQRCACRSFAELSPARGLLEP